MNINNCISTASTETVNPKRSIETKLTWLITLTALSSVLIGGIAFALDDIFQMETDFTDKMILIANTAGNYAAADIEFGDSRAAEQSLNTLHDIPAILNAHLLDKDGKEFSSLNPTTDFHTFDTTSNSVQHSIHNGILVVTAPISHNGNHMGYIQLVASSEEIGGKILNHLVIMAILSAVLSIVVYLLAHWLQGIFSRPILDLADTARKFSELPDYSIRVDYDFPDEIGVLYNSFNKMLNTIEQEQQRTRNALRELKESEARFSAMFNSIPDAVMFADTQRRIRLSNPAVSSLFQYSSDELIGNTTEMLYASKEEFIKQGKLRYNKNSTETSSPYEVQYRRKDGSIVWTESLGSKVITSQGEHIGFLGIFRDITDKKTTEEKLALQQKEQQQILDAMVDAVITMDEAGTIISVNRGAESMFGYQTGKILQRHIASIIPDMHVVTNTINSPGSCTIAREYTGRRKSGDQFPIRVSVAELPRSAHIPRRFIGTCQDISFEKKQEESLQRSQKMDALGKLTGGVAHDFNNMMGVVLGYSQLLQNMLQGDSKERKYVDEIHKAGERAKNLTTKLLAFSHKSPIHAEEININHLLDESRLMLEKTLTVRIELIYDLTQNLWPVYLDKSSFIDSLLNISINAMHAMPNGGSLTLKTRNSQLVQEDADRLSVNAGDYVQLTITDTGAGIPEEIQHRLFEPFFTTKGEMGTGLGLSQVYGFIRQSKGTIQVYSKPGRGTQLVLHFPRNSRLKATIAPDQPIFDDVETSKANILVVDDEASLARMAEVILCSKGHRVYIASNANEALALIKRQSIDIVFSDIIMPGMNGYQLAARIKQEKPNIKIQLVSGYTNDAQSFATDEKLQRNLLLKPYTSKALLSRIVELLKTPEELTQ